MARQVLIKIVRFASAFPRLRWGAAELAAAFPPIPPGNTVKSITIIFDEGQDVVPDFSRRAVIDNIDLNGTVVGRGTGEKKGSKKGEK